MNLGWLIVTFLFGLLCGLLAERYVWHKEYLKRKKNQEKDGK